MNTERELYIPSITILQYFAAINYFLLKKEQHILSLFIRIN